MSFTCKRCGQCCRLAPCTVAIRVYGTDGPVDSCPALLHDGDKYRCLIVENALRGLSPVAQTPMNPALRSEIIEELGIGQECSLPFVQRSLEIQQRRQERAEDALDKLLGDPSVSDADLLAAIGLDDYPF